MRVRLLVGVVLGVASGLFAHRYIPADGIWAGVITGVAVGAAIFVLIQAISGKGKLVT
jgi:hypothetical protein